MRRLVNACEHAEAFTAILTQDLHLSTVEIDEFWSFARKQKRLNDYWLVSVELRNAERYVIALVSSVSGSGTQIKAALLRLVAR